MGTHLRMLGSELVQYVGGVKTSVVAELAGNDLKGFSVSTDQQLLLAWNGPGIVPEVFGKLHLYRTTTGNNRVILKEKMKLQSCSRKGERRKVSFPESVAWQGDANTPDPRELQPRLLPSLGAPETGPEPPEAAASSSFQLCAR